MDRTHHPTEFNRRELLRKKRSAGWGAYSAFVVRMIFAMVLGYELPRDGEDSQPGGLVCVNSHNMLSLPRAFVDDST